MKKILQWSILFAQLFWLCILGWIEYPFGQVRETFSINSSLLSENYPLEKCPYYNVLLSSKYILEYPQSIGTKEQDIFRIFINKLPVSDRFLQSTDANKCEIKIEIWVDTKDFQFFPSGRSFELFNNLLNQSFNFTFDSLKTGNGSGRIWIYANINYVETPEIYRIPLFALPFEIKTKSIFGMPAKLIRLISFINIFLLGLISLRLMNNKKAMI